MPNPEFEPQTYGNNTTSTARNHGHQVLIIETVVDLHELLNRNTIQRSLNLPGIVGGISGSSDDDFDFSPNPILTRQIREHLGILVRPYVAEETYYQAISATR